MEFEYHPEEPNECIIKWRVKNFTTLNKDPIRSKDFGCSIKFQNLDWYVSFINTFIFGFSQFKSDDSFHLFHYY